MEESNLLENWDVRTFIAVFVPFVRSVCTEPRRILQTTSTVISAIGIGLIGRLLGPVSDRVGRKNAVMLAIFETVSFFGMAGTSSFWLLYRQQRLDLHMGVEWWSSRRLCGASSDASMPAQLWDESSRRLNYGSDWPICSTGTAVPWVTTDGPSCFQV